MLSPLIALGLLSCVAGYALLSRKIERSFLTLPMIFTGLGLGLAASIDLKTLKHSFNVPLRSCWIRR